MLAMFKKSEAARMEADFAAMVKREAQLRETAAKMVEAAEAAAAVRRELLLSDGATSAALDKAEKACRAADDRRDAYRDALATLVDRIAATREALTIGKEIAERERAARACEARAAKIQAAAEEAAAAEARLVDRLASLQDVIAAHGHGSEPARAMMDPIRRSVAYAVAPALVPYSVEGPAGRAALGVPEPLVGVLAAVEATQTGLLRALALQQISGTGAGIEPSAPPALRVPVTFADTSIVLREAITYRGTDGRWVQVVEGGTSIPAPVAEAAVAKSIGFSMMSKEGAAILLELRRPAPSGGLKPTGIRLAEDGRPVVRRGPPFTDVGVSLHDLIQADRARATA